MKFATSAALLTISLAFGGAALAADIGNQTSQTYICQPANGETQSYSIQCPVNAGVVDPSCRCPERHVQVNPNTTPIPTPGSSSGG